MDVQVGYSQKSLTSVGGGDSNKCSLQQLVCGAVLGRHGWEEGGDLYLSLYLSLQCSWGIFIQGYMYLCSKCNHNQTIGSQVSMGHPVLIGTAILVWLTYPSFLQSVSAPNGKHLLKSYEVMPTGPSRAGPQRI